MLIKEKRRFISWPQHQRKQLYVIALMLPTGIVSNNEIGLTKSQWNKSL